MQNVSMLMKRHMLGFEGLDELCLSYGVALSFVSLENGSVFDCLRANWMDVVCVYNVEGTLFIRRKTSVFRIALNLLKQSLYRMGF